MAPEPSADELGDEPERRDLYLSTRMDLDFRDPGDLAVTSDDPPVAPGIGQPYIPLVVRPGKAGPAMRRSHTFRRCTDKRRAGRERLQPADAPLQPDVPGGAAVGPSMAPDDLSGHRAESRALAGKRDEEIGRHEELPWPLNRLSTLSEDWPPVGPWTPLMPVHAAQA